jgi:hypothetical protein
VHTPHRSHPFGTLTSTTAEAERGRSNTLTEPIESTPSGRYQGVVVAAEEGGGGQSVMGSRMNKTPRPAVAPLGPLTP